MTIERDLDRRLASFFKEASVETTPIDLLPRSLARVNAAGQRPAWMVGGFGIGATRSVRGTLVPVWIILALLVLAVVSVVVIGSKVVLPAVIVAPSPQATPLVGPSPSAPQATDATGTTGTWTSAGTMNVFRDGFETATLLSDGSVLIAGGNDGRGDVRDPAATSAELFLPTSGRWVQTGSMKWARYEGHTATLLADGTVLVAGGSDYRIPDALSSQLHRAEVYEPSTGTWAETEAMTMAHSDNPATLLPDGRVLVAGGWLADPARLTGRSELYNPGTGAWLQTGSMAAAGPPTTAVLVTGKVLVVHLLATAETDQAPAELYDPSSGTWSQIDSPGVLGGAPQAVPLADGRVLLLSIAITTIYNPISGSWTPAASPIGELRGPFVVLDDGQVLFCDRGSGELYDPASGTWDPAGLPTYAGEGNGPALFRITREGGGDYYGYDTATLLLDGRVLLTIGDQAVLYDPSGAP
jgi:hypothetical protein